MEEDRVEFSEKGTGTEVDGEGRVDSGGGMRAPRPSNAFMIFGKEKRKEVARENPGKSNKEISKILGEAWKHLPEDMRAYYKSLAKEAYELHMKKYPGKEERVACIIIRPTCAGYFYSPLEARKRKAAKRQKTRRVMTLREEEKENPR